MLGVIGGTGLYQLDHLANQERVIVTTPFGPPSAPLVIGTLARQKVAFLPRHGLEHELLPAEINYRANIYALKAIGAHALVSISAVSSLRPEIEPGGLTLPNQYIDLTRFSRSSTFFGNGLAAHVAAADPVCHELARALADAAEDLGVHLRRGTREKNLTYVCVDGPRLRTRAESELLRKMGCDVVGMSNVPEVFLAREARLPYCTIAITSGYEGLGELEGPRQSQRLMDLYAANIGRAKAILEKLCEIGLNDVETWNSRKSTGHVLLTRRDSLSTSQLALLEVLES